MIIELAANITIDTESEELESATDKIINQAEEIDNDLSDKFYAVATDDEIDAHETMTVYCEDYHTDNWLNWGDERYGSVYVYPLEMITLVMEYRETTENGINFDTCTRAFYCTNWEDMENYANQVESH